MTRQTMSIDQAPYACNRDYFWTPIHGVQIEERGEGQRGGRRRCLSHVRIDWTPNDKKIILQRT